MASSTTGARRAGRRCAVPSAATTSNAGLRPEAARRPERRRHETDHRLGVEHPEQVPSRSPSMSLAKAVTHLRAQQWTSVFIELAIVVLGVFIGIQASNWNAAQVEKRKGEEFAQRLLQDLRQDLVGRERMVSYYQAVMDSGEKAIDLLKSPAPDPKALVVNAYRATE